MDDYKYLRQLEAIDPTNAFIRYIIERVIDDNYRGIQCSQHNRLTFDYFSKLIEAIYLVAQDKVFDIHIGDDKGVLQPQANKYYEVVCEINNSVGKGTINSVKKNTFPDIARMGFLNRYDKNGNKVVESGDRQGIYSVGLSEMGIRFANASIFGKIKLFTDGIDILTQNTASQLVELLYLNDYGIDNLTILEFMYIFSDDRPRVSYNDKLYYLLEYRKLSPLQKSKVDECLKNFCNPENRRYLHNKLPLRDYNNWKNESLQIFGLLGNSTYFKVDHDKLILNTGNYGIFDEQTVRKAQAKNEYFKLHNVPRNCNFELHHIVPFSTAQNKSDTVLIDNYKNLIYLSNSKHKEFTIANSKNIILNYKTDNSQMIFLDFDNGFILVDTSTDALLNPTLLPEIKRHNELLIRKFYYK